MIAISFDFLSKWYRYFIGFFVIWWFFNL